jgi:hypothetical protein
MLAPPTDTTGTGSSFWIVPTPCALVITALAAALRLTRTVWSVSFSVSPFTFTVICWLLVPTGKFRTPPIAT